MKFSALLAGILLSTVLALPAAANQIVYRAALTGPSELPPNASTATGTAFVTVDFDLLTMHVQTSFSGLVGNTTASHIHCCTLVPGSANVGVATTLPTFTGFPLGVTSGNYDQIFDMSLAASYNPAFVTAQGSIGAAFNALVAGMDTGNAYFNIHTSTFPGGEIRGLITPVPEPQTYQLLATGLGLLPFVRRRSRSV
jgi:hypothetical protein